MPAAMERLSQLNWCCRTGVTPRFDQVRTRCGRWLSPLSSTKTMIRPSFWAFFKRWPDIVLPVGDRLFVPFPSTAHRPLATPAHLPAENPPHVPGVIPHTKLLSHYLGDPVQCPETVGKPGLLRASQQNLLQLVQFRRPQPGDPARAACLLQSFPGAIGRDLIRPPANALPADFNSPRHFGLAKTSIQQFGGLPAPSLKLIEVPRLRRSWAHCIYRRSSPTICHSIFRRSVRAC